MRSVELRRWQIDLGCRFVKAVGSVDPGRGFLSLPFVFSTVPFCHGACGSQNQPAAPIPLSSRRHAENSVPVKRDRLACLGGQGRRPGDQRFHGRLGVTILITHDNRKSADPLDQGGDITLSFSLREIIRSRSQWPNS